MKGCDDYVIKYNENWGANDNEYKCFEIVNNLGGTVSKHLGQIYSMSKSKKYLVMEYLQDIHGDQYYKAEYPSGITDIRRENFGITKNGDIKMRDYALYTLPVGKTLCRVPNKEEIKYMSEDAKYIGDLLGE
ncbi:hypothetical protein [Aeromonas caviae]|uniref:hypothetical protein n=1 Tax=Aeromonas caviae TaxID=648 RepID=UPI002B49893F|nr:hypothetical protein [Aeromonas caviae]